MTADLVQFLRDRLDDDEAHAKKDLWAAANATPSQWRAHYGVNLDHSWVKTESTPVLQLDAAQHQADALLVARFQPATVTRRATVKLAEVEAKRRITECHEPWTAGNGDTICGRCGREHIDGRPGGHFPCETLRLLALPYADHPDYRDDWRP